uniref:Elongation of very long chain fatty acids protein n=1 Tax=Culicoides sonorensis TaxID=179676 RepID=A0A336LS88_CULSO
MNSSFPLDYFLEKYERLKIGHSPMVDSWPLFSSPVQVTAILLSYMIFVLYLGPKYMKNRKAYDLKNVIILYNALQVYHNYWMISTAVSHKNFFKFFLNFGCANVTPEEMADIRNEIYRAFWHVSVNKMFDLLDTVFFVLRKKQSHITFLHVHHHVAMVAICWTFAKYYPGQEPTIVGFVNVSVHMVMYTYYLLAALGPEYRKYLWWKKYLTLVQIVQFVTIILYSTASLWLSCDFNRNVVKLIIFEATVNLVLFLNFYFKTYEKARKRERVVICGSLQINQKDILNKNFESISNDTNQVSSEVQNDHNWFLWSSPIPIIGIVIGYLIFVLYIGPKWMKNRAPYNLKHIIIAYNIMQVMHNLYMLWIALTSISLFRVFFSFNCAALTPHEESAWNYDIRHGFWIYTMNKLLDLIDTVFFVLRKKQRHISFLHVYHHSSMPLLAFFFGKYAPGHEPTIVALCNTTIHVMMYSYYLMAAAGPKFRRFLWLKKYITMMQMFQFCLIICYLAMAFFNSCGFNKVVSGLIIAQAGLNLFLFANFYRRAYLNKKQDENNNLIKSHKIE